MFRRLAMRLAMAVVIGGIPRAALAADVPLVNRLGLGITAVYAHAPGHELWKIAGPLADGGVAMVDTSTLRASRRLIIGTGEEGGALQFFHPSYLSDVERMEFALRRPGGGARDIPVLVTVENGIRDEAIAGLPFDILLSFLESENGLDATRYADLMTPLATDGPKDGEFSVASRDTSWRLLPPGPAFRSDGEGKQHLAGIAFAANMTRRALLDFFGEFHGTAVVPTTIRMEDGTAYSFGGEEAKKYPDTTLLEETRDTTREKLWEILAKRLNGWLAGHGTPDRSGMRLSLESPEALYVLHFDAKARTAELHVRRKDAGADDESFPPFPAGLNFRPAALAGGTDFEGGVALPDGRWWMREVLAGRPIVHEARRLTADEYENGVAPIAGDETDLHRLILAEFPEARDILVSPFEALAEKTSYPALKAVFLTGEGDNIRLHSGAFLGADDWSFWHLLDTPLEGGGERQRGELEKLLLTLDPVPDGAPMPGKCVPVHNTEAYRPSAGGIDIMDALIRMERIADPAGNPWRAGENFAYRCDGTETADGGPRLLFSFGVDSREKFTAERHFAVDGQGTVYEMDAVSGPEYSALPETPPNWWGEYHDDGKTLHIGNFRQGPMGYYFLFSFEINGKPAFNGAASVSGRKATFANILFRLGEGDDSVDVTVDKAPEASENTDLLRSLAGVYARK